MSRADLWRRIVVRFASAAFLSTAGCDPTTVTFRIVDAVDQDPYLNADSLRIGLENRNGERIREWKFAIDDPAGRISPLGEGRSLSLVVETLAGERVVSRGRSFPFDLDDRRSPPHPDVYVGRLGRFSTPIATPASTASPLAIATTSSGALWIDEVGDVYRFVVHERASEGVVPGEPNLVRIANHADRADASWVALSGGRLLGVGGTLGGAIVVDEAGGEVATLPDTDAALLQHRFGAALAAIDSAVLVVGGAPDPGAPPTRTISRIEISASGTSLVASQMDSQVTARRDAVALAIEVRGRPECPCTRVGVFGGRDLADERSIASIVDPTDVDIPVELDHPAIRPGVAILEISGGILMLAGGRDALGAPVDEVDVLLARTDGLVALSPPAPPLFFPRTDATGIRISAGLGIVVGGLTTFDVPSDAVELVEFPGNTLPTGSLGVPAAGPGVVVLENRAILVVDAGLVTLYESPRSF